MYQIRVPSPSIPWCIANGGELEKRTVAEETDLLVHEVKTRKQTIYGGSRTPPKLPEVRYRHGRRSRPRLWESPKQLHNTAPFTVDQGLVGQWHECFVPTMCLS